MAGYIGGDPNLDKIAEKIEKLTTAINTASEGSARLALAAYGLTLVLAAVAIIEILIEFEVFKT